MKALLLLLILDLHQYLDRNRLLLLFSPNSSDTRLVEQRRLLAGEQSGLDERDLRVFEILSSGHPDDALRTQFHVQPDEFRIILVGKDGGEKWASDRPTEIRKIFAKIDAMPMRKNEMKSRRH